MKNKLALVMLCVGLSVGAFCPAHAQTKCDPTAFLTRDTDLAILNTRSALSYLATSSQNLDQKATDTLLGKMGAAIEGVPVSFGFSHSQAKEMSRQIRSSLGIDASYSQDQFVLRQALSDRGATAYLECLRSIPLTVTFGSDPTPSKLFGAKVSWNPSYTTPGAYRVELTIRNGKFDTPQGRVDRLSKPIVAQGTLALTIVDRDPNAPTAINASITTGAGDDATGLEAQVIDIPRNIAIKMETSFVTSKHLYAKAPGKHNTHHFDSDCIRPKDGNSVFVPSVAGYTGVTDKRRLFTWKTVTPNLICAQGEAIPYNDTTAIIDGTFMVMQVTYTTVP